MSHAHSHDSSHSEPHVVPFKVHFGILSVLLFLTVVTVWIAGVDFGAMNIVVAMIIASIKAGLVGMYFMHLKYERPEIWVFVLFPILLLVFMIGGLFLDNPTRQVPGKDVLWVPGFVQEAPKSQAH